MREGKEDERKASTSINTAASLAVCCKSLGDWDLLFLKEQFVIFRALCDYCCLLQTDLLSLLELVELISIDSAGGGAHFSARKI